ncbi:ATP-binding protein [Clostridiaceae bacterium UIB06]|uniref:ATP-binding protein n=1 Tax=Clostridium thailandense TaxID=2794346 RepID=A0A949TRC8_9CLOT|nr:ATP-binding protein [Clostridium thailandense]MBV7271886.1 ATP-binding protein [Clostridium thailandense]MCH5137112.1 ATP-binding protein [Clostridiaceae bacterium UIB06]
MNFTDAMLTVDLVIKSGAVPLIIGESGIGKTALIKELARKEGYYAIVIDANILKEGEIGGLPTVQEYQVTIDGKEIIRKKTVYAIHTKLLEIDEVLKEDSSKKILLFIDEINRCEHSVQQELMNLILNREINGYLLPSNVRVIAAMNPSNKYETFTESNYQVVDMDPAQENRFVWVELESDVKEWLKWAMEKSNCVEETNIHEQISEFIASFPEYLHTPYSQEYIKATPRSWERISNAYKVYLNSEKTIPAKIFYNVVVGNVGQSIAQDFNNYLEDYQNPIIKPEEIFFSEEISDELAEKVEKESHSRLYLSAKNALIYLDNMEHREREIKLFSEFIQLYPADLKMGIMKEIKLSYENSLYMELLNEKTFVDGYFSVYAQL